MGKKYTTDMAGPFLNRVAARRAAVAQAEKELSTVIGEGVEELGTAFSHHGQEYAIRYYKTKGEFSLCVYRERPGAHLRKSTQEDNQDIAEAEDLGASSDSLIEAELTVGENLLDDPQYGFPTPPTYSEPSTVVI